MGSIERADLDKQFELLSKTMDKVFNKVCGEEVDNDIKALITSYILENPVRDGDIKGLYESFKRDKKIKKLLDNG